MCFAVRMRCTAVDQAIAVGAKAVVCRKCDRFRSAQRGSLLIVVNGSLLLKNTGVTECKISNLENPEIRLVMLESA